MKQPPVKSGQRKITAMPTAVSLFFRTTRIAIAIGITPTTPDIKPAEPENTAFSSEIGIPREMIIATTNATQVAGTIRRAAQNVFR